MKLSSPLYRSVNRISLTPLIDIVFILLIFFILETNFLPIREVGLNLSETRLSGQVSSRVLDIEVMESGKIWVEGRALMIDALAGFMEQKQLSPESSVIITAADGVPLQMMISVIDVVQESGTSRLRIRSMGDE